MSGPVAVYVHTPFCPTKCGYCDFNSYAGMEALRERTVRAIVQEIRDSPLRSVPAKTVFFGGGTPTYLSEGQIRRILEAVAQTHPPTADCEITSEANPGTVDIPKFGAMRKMGFNRVSLGAQSFLDDDLRRLGRVHRSAEIERAVAAARSAGFGNLNLDLMFALPGQSLDAWRANLDKAASLSPDHLSLYCLTLEPNTPFYKDHLAGRLVVPDDEEQAAMYDLAISYAEARGYRQYEISNFARPGFECRHNLVYWRYGEYIGYGPGAVGCLEGERAISGSIRAHRLDASRMRKIELELQRVGARPNRGCAGSGGRLASVPLAVGRLRYTNVKHPARYCEAVESGEPLWCEWEGLGPETQRIEKIMLGLRLNEGLPLEGLSISDRSLAGLQSRGWIERSDGVVRLTREGRHWCSDVTLTLA